MAIRRVDIMPNTDIWYTESVKQLLSLVEAALDQLKSHGDRVVTVPPANFVAPHFMKKDGSTVPATKVSVTLVSGWDITGEQVECIWCRGRGRYHHSDQGDHQGYMKECTRCRTTGKHPATEWWVSKVEATIAAPERPEVIAEAVMCGGKHGHSVEALAAAVLFWHEHEER